MKVNIKVSPSPQKLANMFLGAEAKLARRLWEGMTAYAYLIQEKSVKQTPVDQGGLRGSIGTDLEPKKFRAIIKPNVPYDRWLHEGWMRRNGKIVYLLGHGRAGTPFGGKPFMYLGAGEAQAQGNRIISAKISQAIKEI